MSQTSSQTNTTSAELEIIEFYLDEIDANGQVYRSYYGMNVAKVIEIIRRPLITGVPSKHHPAALGTFNLRGRVLPLVDLSTWLGKTVADVPTTKVIVSEFSSIITAFIVSGVTRIHRMTWAQVEAPGKHLQAFSHGCITGVVRFEDRIVFLLDMEQVIASMDPNVKLSNNVVQEGDVEGDGYHILVVDDSPSIRSIIVNCLEQAKFSVTTGACGRDAWDQLLAWDAKAKAEGIPLSHFVNLVISDIEMPLMDGHTLTRLIKEHADFNHLPVILFSSIISDVVKQKGMSVGADDHIAKPDLPQLALRAKALLEIGQHKKDT